MKILVINHYKGLTEKKAFCFMINLQDDLKEQENNIYPMRKKPPINIMNEAFNISDNVNYIFFKLSKVIQTGFYI